MKVGNLIVIDVVLRLGDLTFLARNFSYVSQYEPESSIEWMVRVKEMAFLKQGLLSLVMPCIVLV